MRRLETIAVGFAAFFYLITIAFYCLVVFVILGRDD